MSDPDEVERLARRIHAFGLATPALILFDTFAPLAWVGEQALAALNPLLPQHMERPSSVLHLLRDEHQRARLRTMLANDGPPTNDHRRRTADDE